MNNISNYFINTYREAIQSERLQAHIENRPVNQKNIALYEHIIREIEAGHVNVMR